MKKYCKKCKISARDTDTVCAKCGNPVYVFGASATSPAGGGTTAGTVGGGLLSLQGKVRDLEEARKKVVVFGRGLSLLSLLVLLLILFILYQVYSRTVLAYAVIDNIRFEQDPVAEGLITVTYDVKVPGKVAFDRRSGSSHMEKVDLIASPVLNKSTKWSWPSEPKSGIDFHVLYRGGLLRASVDKHFDVTRSEVGVEVVFLLDITSSMGPYIEGLKKNCNDFADQIRKEGVDCRLGLIGFGDVAEGDEFVVLEPTSKISDFQSKVASLRMVGGGDAPESSVEAMDLALKMKFRPHTRVCFIHITDAGCHEEDRIPAQGRALKDRKIITHVLSLKRQQTLYRPWWENGGFHGLRDGQFDEILKEVAKSVVDEINSD